MNDFFEQMLIDCISTLVDGNDVEVVLRSVRADLDAWSGRTRKRVISPNDLLSSSGKVLAMLMSDSSLSTKDIAVCLGMSEPRVRGVMTSLQGSIGLVRTKVPGGYTIEIDLERALEHPDIAFLLKFIGSTLLRGEGTTVDISRR